MLIMLNCALCNCELGPSWVNLNDTFSGTASLMSEEHTVRLRNRIKAIIDLVDTQNWKKVNKLCKQLLDEFPNSSMAKVRLF